jgi:hypothetical protein
MNPPSDDFEALRRLLALKRYEQPPPGYFDRLADSIMVQIEAVSLKVPWWERLLGGRELAPAMAGTFALLVGGVYLLGLSPADHPENASAGGSGFVAAGAPEWSGSSELAAAHAMIPAGAVPVAVGVGLDNGPVGNAGLAPMGTLTPSSLFATPSRFADTNPVGAANFRMR